MLSTVVLPQPDGPDDDQELALRDVERDVLHRDGLLAACGGKALPACSMRSRTVAVIGRSRASPSAARGAAADRAAARRRPRAIMHTMMRLSSML